jgi:hypothetical protein
VPDTFRDYGPPMDWMLSGEAERYIENSVIATEPACNAKANVEAIEAMVRRLKGGLRTLAAVKTCVIIE